jgi:hypothetical protein
MKWVAAQYYVTDKLFGEFLQMNTSFIHWLGQRLSMIKGNAYLVMLAAAMLVGTSVQVLSENRAMVGDLCRA